MNNRLEGLQPERVFYYFEELTRIPHGSGNTKKISDYCADMAKAHGLEYYQDELNNLIIIKPASAGYAESPAVMLQGHLDMVNEKTDESAHDFSKDPLDIDVDEDWIYAHDTTLGGDDGIAVAMMLAILEDQSLAHPRLECVFTIDEEVGMEGAAGIDLSMCRSRYLLNLDSEEEGIMLSSCAGGVRYDLQLPVRYAKAKGVRADLVISGLKGGHSGAEIDKQRANANILMGRLLFRLDLEGDYSLNSLEGGSKDNAITRTCRAELLVDEEAVQTLEKETADFLAEIRNEYQTVDPDIDITLEFKTAQQAQILNPLDHEKVIFLLMQAPYGVQAMSTDIEGLVETSLNLGVMRLTEDHFMMRYSIRSCINSRKKLLCDKLEYLIQFLGGDFTFTGDYPEWEYKRDSNFRALLADVYEEKYGSKMQVQAIHAGLECGIIGKKLPGIDMVSIGPDMKDIHTPQERLSISSTARTYDFVCEVLKRMQN